MATNKRWIGPFVLGAVLLTAGGWVTYQAAFEHKQPPFGFGLLCEAAAFAHVLFGIMLRRYYALGRHLVLAFVYASIVWRSVGEH